MINWPQQLIDHRSPPITDRSILSSFCLARCSTPITDHRSSIIDHRSIVRFYASCSRISRTIIDHRSPIIDHRSIVRFYASDAVGSVVRSSITDHRSSINRSFLRMLVYHAVVRSDHRLSITNRSTGSKQLYRSPITDHRGNTSLRILCTRLPWNHRSPIIDHKPLNRFQTVVSITDHRSPRKHKSTHFMYQTAVESSITDHRSQTAQPVPNSWRPTVQPVPNSWRPTAQPVPNSWRPTAQPVPNSWRPTAQPVPNSWQLLIRRTHYWQNVSIF